MDIKTDWTPDDYYNIHDDLTRTEGNPRNRRCPFRGRPPGDLERKTELDYAGLSDG